jgi:hypothetical protein
MASSKQKTTMNKLNRERKLRERRVDKELRKLARANGEADAQAQPDDQLQDHTDGADDVAASSGPITLPPA